MLINRRVAAKGLLAGFSACAVAAWRPSPAVGSYDGWRSFTLANGFRTHYAPNGSGYVTAALALRSSQIAHDGLAHVFEHTSAAGAARGMSASDNARMQSAYIQDGNASTEPGILSWYASFLPQYLPQVIELLAATSLDQAFDLETVETQARVVLEELYLEKYAPANLAQNKFNRAVYGSSHPYAKDTMEAEVARCKVPPRQLAAQLRDFAASVRLPANMDLFLAVSMEPAVVEKAVSDSFGRIPFAEGPRLEIPLVAVTRNYRRLAEISYELNQPMAELHLAWNTGVCITSGEARVVKALSEYLATALFDQLREKEGNTYSPDVDFSPDGCSGILKISITSSKGPGQVERRVLEVIEKMKADIDESKLKSLRDRIRLKHLRDASDNSVLVDSMVERAFDGASYHDLLAETVTQEELLAAARKYLPSHKRDYVRLALKGQ